MLGESVCRSEAGLEWLKSLFWTIGGVAKLFGLEPEPYCDIFVAPDECRCRFLKLNDCLCESNSFLVSFTDFLLAAT